MFIHYYTGNVYLVVWAGYVALPILEYVMPVWHRNLPPERVRAFEKDWRFNAPLYILWFIDFIYSYTIIYLVSIGRVATTPF